MELRTLGNVICGAKIVPEDTVIELGDGDAKALIKSGAATAMGNDQTTTPPKVIGDFVNQADPEKFLMTFKLDELRALGAGYKVAGETKAELTRGILEAVTKPSSPTVYSQADLEKMSEADLMKIAGDLKVPGGKKADVIKGIMEVQPKAE